MNCCSILIAASLQGKELFDQLRSSYILSYKGFAWAYGGSQIYLLVQLFNIVWNFFTFRISSSPSCISGN